MSDNSKYKIDENSLDQLLDESFLDLDFDKPENKIIMEAISKDVLITGRYAEAGNVTINTFSIALLKRISLLVF